MRNPPLKKLLPLLAVAAVTLVGCNPPPTGPSLAPGGQSVPSSGRIMSGTVQGAKLGATTKIALSGSFTNGQGGKIDALGRPITGDATVIASVPVKEGKYAMDLPAVPVGAVAGGFEVLAYNDANNNSTIDEGEYKAKGNGSQIVFAAVLGYNVLNTTATALTDALALDKVNVVFN
jgi:hypothetical protein